jgi:hypothetical protein
MQVERVVFLPQPIVDTAQLAQGKRLPLLSVRCAALSELVLEQFIDSRRQ